MLIVIIYSQTLKLKKDQMHMKIENQQKKYNLKYKKDGIEWEGENLANKTILILTEQGIADIIQFGRYLYSLKEKYLV